MKGDDDGIKEGKAKERCRRRSASLAAQRSLVMNRSAAFFAFLTGVAAVMVGVLLSEWLRSLRERRLQEQALFPDPGHLGITEEEHAEMFSPPQAEPPPLEPKEEPPITDPPEPPSFPKTELQQRRPSQVQNYEECEAEALKTLHAATSSHSRGANDRAKKLFDHAFNLCPNHPKVLVAYGEFLEAAEKDLVTADHFYARAMALSDKDSEDHSRALWNRKRTATMVEQLDRKALQRIDDKKKAFQRISEGNSAMRRAKKEAYFQHIYHSVSIEGNTMTLSQTRSILETKLAVGGKSVMEHNEVLGLDLALRYINQTLVDRVGEITLQDILEIHKRVIGFVDPMEAGMMRRTQVYVGDYVPPHPSHIEMLMQKFVLWLNSPDNVEFHPISFAALAHYKLVYIHPFVDGNGRTSRLLMNLILMQSGFPPVIIRKQDRLSYYKHLVSANEGDIRPFVRFIAECTERTLDAYVSAATESPATARGQPSGLAPFLDESETIISAQDHLDYHDAVIMGDVAGPNETLQP